MDTMRRSARRNGPHPATSPPGATSSSTSFLSNRAPPCGRAGTSWTSTSPPSSKSLPFFNDFLGLLGAASF
ncbi:hypothetical protein ACFXTH_035362 [Malus domestica]